MRQGLRRNPAVLHSRLLRPVAARYCAPAMRSCRAGFPKRLRPPSEVGGREAGNEAAESIAWTFLHEPSLVTVAGHATQQPRYRVVVGVPQATLDDEAKAGLVAEVTEQVLRAEKNGQDPAPEDSSRVWVIVNEITDGNWGAPAGSSGYPTSSPSRAQARRTSSGGQPAFASRPFRQGKPENSAGPWPVWLHQMQRESGISRSGEQAASQFPCTASKTDVDTVTCGLAG